MAKEELTVKEKNEIKENTGIKEMDPQEKRFHRRKDRIKTFAIVFLAIMLVLTFFSNTIMNYSLPQVATEYVQSGSITTIIRGTGSVQSGDPYNVMVYQEKKVNSVNVKVGQTVAEGDLLLTLAAEDSSELKAAKQALEAAEDAYNSALLSADVTAADISAAQNGGSTDRSKITDAQNAIEAAQLVVDKAQETYDTAVATLTSLKNQLSAAQNTYVDTTAETNAVNSAKSALETASFNLTSAQNTLDTLQSQYEYYVGLEDEQYNDKITELATKIDAAKLDVINKSTAKADAQLTYDKAVAALEAKQNTGNASTISALNAQIASQEIVVSTAETDLNAAKEALTEKQTYLTDLVSESTLRFNLANLYQNVQDAKAEVEKLTAEGGAADINSPIAGTVLYVNVASGKKVDTSMAAVVIQPEGQGYYMTFSLENDQAKKVSVGDVASVSNSWWYSDITGVVSAIRPDTSNPNRAKTITVDLKGSLTEGQSLTMEIDSRTTSYDLVVPNSAIHEDKNGKFILIVESKSSPLGNRYFAVRYDVTVLASDDNKTAITGALNGYEYVITTTSKPINAGDQVRLSES